MTKRICVRDFTDFVEILEEKGKAKYNEGDFLSASFYFRKASENMDRGSASPQHLLQQPVNYHEIGVRLEYFEAKALLKAKKYSEAQDAITNLARRWGPIPIPNIPDDLRADVFFLTAELYEFHGSLPTLESALYWLQETLDFNSEHPTVKEDIKRVKKKIHIADSSNW
ncbi:hypothetical protein P7C71_g515, partial [Lecanoromycetidae sp. Uapishka_2]